MIVVFGERLYGRVARVGGTCVATMFFFIQYLPVVPLGSRIVLEEGPGEDARTLPITLHGRSVFAAYVRTWGIAAAILIFFGAVISATFARTASDVLASALPAIGVVSLGVAAFAWLGAVDDETTAQRLVHQRHYGYPVDVGLLGAHGEPCAASLRAAIQENTRRDEVGYRAREVATTDYLTVALDPAVLDRELLAAAYTLACLDEAAAEGAERARVGRQRAAIWERIRAEEIALLREGRASKPGWKPLLAALPVALTAGLFAVLAAMAH